LQIATPQSMVAGSVDSRNWRALLLQHHRARFWVLTFLAFQILCQLALLRPEFQSIRSLVRSSSFGINLVFLVVVLGKTHFDFAGKVLLGSLGVLAIGVLHPETHSFVTAIGVVVFYLAVFSSLFWISRLQINLDTLRILMIAFWAFHALSAVTGVLQTYFPGQFQGAVTKLMEGSASAQGLIIQLDDGTQIFRPMGLTDSPGGAAVSGMYVCLLGMALLLDPRYRWWGLVFAGGMIAGLYCLMLCQLRIFVVALFICTVTFLSVLSYRGEGVRALRLGSWLGAIIVLASVWAVSIGREAVVGRLSTLLAADPISVYRGNRGAFLEYTFNYAIWEYPFGAGLGRWGMVNAYFGDPATSLWSEINWTAWCFDGGIALILIYAVVMTYLAWRAFHITADRSEPEWCIWGAMLVAYNMAFMATTFCGNPLLSQIGVEYFMINGVIYTAWKQHLTDRHIAAPARLSTESRAEVSAPRGRRRSSVPRAIPAIVQSSTESS
jgi:hypothetical protein